MPGVRIAEQLGDCTESYGTEEEFNNLSGEDRDKEWDEFHERCVQGDADGMYFYRVMMDKWLVGYVGH